MSHVLTKQQRTTLDNAVQLGRRVAERGARNSLTHLAVADERVPGYLSDEGLRALRRDLRDKAKQLAGTPTVTDQALTLLVGEVAYEQWHRLLFARFLEANGLLRDPASGAAVTMEDCADLADHFGEPDAWSLAASFASEILPGVFRLTDAAVRLRLAPDDLGALEAVVQGIDVAMFIAEDALGWVYQFWQTAQKAAVNKAGNKIGGADIPAVTQLFTENYMVRFLLENSIGAWWATRHPDSPLIQGWKFLRRLDDSSPAAGSFSNWPSRSAEVTVIDPCCGSGHFLVAAFGMLWRMRCEEEGLSPAEAQDSVLRENLFGLELDPRCTQLASFNVILEAWKQGGYRKLPVPQIACSGIPVRGTNRSWQEIADDDLELRATMSQLHSQFRHADTLGSLINPAADSLSGALLSDSGSLQSTDLGKTLDALESIVGREGATKSVFGDAIGNISSAARLLSRTYTLAATNVPFLSSGKQSDLLAEHLRGHYGEASLDLATSMWMRCRQLAPTGNAIVCPQTWRFLDAYVGFRHHITSSHDIHLIAGLGAKAFSTPMWDFSVGLQISSDRSPSLPDYVAISVVSSEDAQAKARDLIVAPTHIVSVPDPLRDSRMVYRLSAGLRTELLSRYARVVYGTKPGQTVRVTRQHWEFPSISEPWLRLSSSPSGDEPYSGNSEVILDPGAMRDAGVTEFSLSGFDAHGKPGVLISKMGRLPAALYVGGVFDDNTYVIQPKDSADLGALWQFAQSSELARSVREINEKTAVPTGAVERCGIDIDHWRGVAADAVPLPQPHSGDVTQWLFRGIVDDSSNPLQVATARLLGYRWPDQASDSLDEFEDADGIVCVPAVGGELDASTRLRALLAHAYGDSWNASKERELVIASGERTGDLGAWLRDSFFSSHVKQFQQKPFIWHIWDGLKDGFSALVNYHKLDHP